MGVEEVVGIELNEEVAQKGREYYKEIFTGNVEEMALSFEAEYFDCILYGDVLEHLVNPWKLLKEQSIFLKKGGAVICSIPNVRQYRTLLKLAFRGKWEYVEDGILDRSHLRFFTLSSIRSMIEEAGLEIENLIKRPHGSAWAKAFNRVLGNRLIDLLVRQYVVVAVKPGKTEN